MHWRKARSNAVSETSLDCRGLPCPQPVLKCKQCLDQSAPTQIRVVVDNEAARENVTRYLTTRGYTATSQKIEGGFAVTAARQGEACEACQVVNEAEAAQTAQPAAEAKVVVFVTAETMGRGDDVLGGKLMFNFLSTLPELGSDLWRLVLVNGGVRLATEGHSCLEKVQALESAGVSVLVCGTCLDHFRLLEKKRAGQTTNMLDVVTSLQLATKIIRI